MQQAHGVRCLRQDLAVVSVGAIVVIIEGDKSLVLVAPTVPGVQTVSISSEKLGLTQVLSSSLLPGWKPRVGPGDFAVQVPKQSLPSILAHLMRENTQVRQMQILTGVRSQSSHSTDWSLLQGSKGSKLALKSSMMGLSSGHNLWQGVMDDELEEEDEEDDVPDPQHFSVRKPSLALHSAGLFNHVPTVGSVNVDRLIQIKMLKLLRRSKGKRDSVDSSSGSSPESLSNDRLKGKGFTGVRKLRRRYHRHPRRLINFYVLRLKEIIGVHHKDQRWGFRNLSMRIKRTLGKMTGLWRCHLILQEIIQLQLAGDHVLATALTCQLSKCNWETALLLIPFQNATGDTPFGGDEEELESFHAYMRSLRELKLKANNRDGDKVGNDDDDSVEPVEAAPKRGARSK